MLRCSKCGQEKSESEFDRKKSKRGYAVYCKLCRAVYWAAYYANPEKRRKKLQQQSGTGAAYKERAREFVAALKHGPCMDCGGRYHPWQMQFDHARGHKVRDVSAMAGRNSLEAIRVEIAKCDLVCANCHADRTYRRLKGLAGGSGAEPSKLSETGSTPVEVAGFSVDPDN